MKKRIFFSLLLSAFPFAANAAIQITGSPEGFFDGTFANSSALDSAFAGKCVPRGNNKYFWVRSAGISGSRAAFSAQPSGHALRGTFSDENCQTRISSTPQNTLYVYGQIIETCPEGEEFNENGICEVPPDQCDIGYIPNEIGLCVPDPEDDFCENEFTNLEASEMVACIDRFPDHFTKFSSSCTSRESYSFSCEQGVPKPTPIDPPSGEFNPSTPPTSNPTPPEFDKPEPDEVLPDETTDKALLTAITNLNRDNNQAIHGLNKDINQSLADSKGVLDNIETKSQAIGDELAQQTLQAYLLSQAEQGLQSQTVDSIQYGTSRIQGAVNNQTGVIRDQTTAITDGLKDISDKLDSQVSNVSSSSCSTFSCTGDEIQCYLARREWERSCLESNAMNDVQLAGTSLLGDLQTITENSIDENGAFTNVFTEAEGSVDEALDAYSTSNGFSFAEGCPASRSYNLGIASFSIDYTPFCKLALVFRALLMASAALGSFFMIAKFI